MDVQMDHENRGEQVTVEPVEIVRGPGEYSGGRVPLAGGGSYDGPQLAHQGSGLHVVPLHVADDENQPVVDSDRVEPVATDVHAGVAGAVARGQLHRTDGSGDVRQEAALEGQAERALLGELAFALLVEPAPLDCRGDRSDQHVDEGKVAWARQGGVRVVHGKGAQNPSADPDDRRRPTGSEPGAQRELLEVDPERIGIDVLHDDLAPAVRRGAARANGWPDLDAMDRGVVVRRQARRGSVQQMLAFLVQEED